MAVAYCGQQWSWDSPMWCTGKKVDEKIDSHCISCPWYKGNNHNSILDHDND